MNLSFRIVIAAASAVHSLRSGSMVWKLGPAMNVVARKMTRNAQMSTDLDEATVIYTANEPASNTRYWLRLIHDHRNQVEATVANALEKIGLDSGWSEDALPIVFLKSDISQFRAMADGLEAKLDLLTRKSA
jgi:hypothetical protein